MRLLLRLLGLEYGDSFFQIVKRAESANLRREHGFIGLYRRLHVLGDQFLDFYFTLASLSDFAISFNARHVSMSSSEQGSIGNRNLNGHKMF